MRGRGERNWLLIKKKDEHSLSDWSLKSALTDSKKRELRVKDPPCRAH